MTPAGKVVFRAIDHQSTFGLYVGETAVRDGKGTMTSYKYDGGAFQPSDDEVRRRRPAD